MKVLVTGANGFVGRHLAAELDKYNHFVSAFEHPDAGQFDHISEVYYGDICDKSAVANAIRQSLPDACIHLAALSFVPEGKIEPDQMMSINYQGTLNLLDCIREYKPDCRTLVASTAHVYGQDKGSEPVKEDDGLNPASVYAESKAKADLGALAYASEHDMHIMTARPHNHIGPGQSPKFVVPSFAKQAKAIADKQKEAVIHVGNLESERDFTDVRDVVRAYRMLLEQGKAGRAYNIASDCRHRIGEVLEMLLDIAQIDPEINVDESLYRPTDYSAILDTTRIANEAGWKPAIDLQKTLSDIYEDISI